MTDSPPVVTRAEPQGHPYDYYWRPGMTLRPAPPRLAVNDIWTHSRRKVLAPWIDFQDEPRETERTRLLVDHLWQGDELMDAVVARFREMGMRKGRRMLDQALDEGIESVPQPPAELIDLFNQLDNPPAWYDPDVWERGRQLWVGSSFMAKVGMLVGDTFGTFVGDEVAYSTGATGRFVNIPVRRYFETVTWFHSMTVKGALDRFAEPFKNTVRVRLMHAQVRAGLRRSWGDEQFDHHANPISNSMMLGAAMTFGLIPPLVDHHQGRTRSWCDLDAAVMYWAYIAYLFGVADELIPTNASEGLETMDYMVATAGGPSGWTDSMVGALVDGDGIAGYAKRLALTPFLGMMAYYGGEDLARALVRSTGLANAPLKPWIASTSSIVWANVALRRVLDKLPGTTGRAATRGDLLWGSSARVGSWLASRDGIKSAPFDHHDRTASTRIGCPVGPAAS